MVKSIHKPGVFCLGIRQHSLVIIFDALRLYVDMKWNSPSLIRQNLFLKELSKYTLTSSNF